MAVNAGVAGVAVHRVAPTTLTCPLGPSALARLKDGPPSSLWSRFNQVQPRKNITRLTFNLNDERITPARRDDDDVDVGDSVIVDSRRVGISRWETERCNVEGKKEDGRTIEEPVDRSHSRRATHVLPSR